jgi:5-hydroxyisourate hydrolase
MSRITTHVLDTAVGRPAVGLSVALERLAADGSAAQVGAGMTDADGRVRDLLAPGRVLEAGDYRLRFETGAYFTRERREHFYPVVHVTFRVAAGASMHYHVPLLLNPFGFSTYRGS